MRVERRGKVRAARLRFAYALRAGAYLCMQRTRRAARHCSVHTRPVVKLCLLHREASDFTIKRGIMTTLYSYKRACEARSRTATHGEVVRTPSALSGKIYSSDQLHRAFRPELGRAPSRAVLMRSTRQRSFTLENIARPRCLLVALQQRRFTSYRQDRCSPASTRR